MTQSTNPTTDESCGACPQLSRVFGLAVCCAWDTGLKKQDGRVMRCKECVSHDGVRNESGED